MQIPKPSQSRQSGFTLIELMITVAILGIIAAIAIPAYQGSIRKSNRADAKVALADLSQQMERCFTQFNAYDNSNCPGGADNAIVSPLPNGNYTMEHAAGSPTAISYTLVAETNGSQTNDTACKTFSINNIGVKAATDSADAATTSCNW